VGKGHEKKVRRLSAPRVSEIKVQVRGRRRASLPSATDRTWKHSGDVVYRHACKFGSKALTIEMSAHLYWVGIRPPVTAASSLSASTPFSLSA
jgi:hypothetical protein